MMAAGTDSAPPASDIERSELSQLSTSERLEDAGLFLVTGGRFDRTEAFKIVRHADGGRTLTATITGSGDSYRVEGRWRYAPDDRALSATGRGEYSGAPVEIDISVQNEVARIILKADGLQKEHTASCPADCLIDMAPSALPMFTMATRYDEARGGPQVFRWVGRSMIIDQVLLTGSAEIRKLGDRVFEKDGREIPVKQYVFVETLKDEESGRFFRVAFNLYTTPDNRPLAFGTSGTTRGERQGYEGITTALPPEIPALD